MASIQACLARSPLEHDHVILYFPHGLPGFEHARRFTVREPAELAPLVCLESLDIPRLRLWVAPVSALDARYSIEISPEDLKVLGLNERRKPVAEKDVVCLAILCVGADGELSANLLAPIVVNLRAHVALQAVRSDATYSHRHPIAAAVTAEERC